VVTVFDIDMNDSAVSRNLLYKISMYTMHLQPQTYK